jgi:hypothetical protein
MILEKNGKYKAKCNSGHVWYGPVRMNKDQAEADFQKHITHAPQHNEWAMKRREANARYRQRKAEGR